MQQQKYLGSLLFILLMLIGYLGYELYTRKIPCVTPVTYALSSNDKRFGLSDEQINDELHQAAQLWNNELGRQVFVEGENPELPVLFVYDEAQQAVDTIAATNEDIEKLKAKQDALGKQYATLKSDYETAVRQGTATREMVDHLNSVAKQFNALRLDINANIAKERNAVPEGDIDNGRYVSDEKGQRIYIYSFQNKNERIRALMHEFGHALGLNHVKNEESIMYPVNSEDDLILSAEDKAELARACNLNN